MAGAHGSYIIGGRRIANEHLTLATLGTIGGLYLIVSGITRKPTPTTPPIKASSAEEEEFIKEFLKNAEAEEKKEKH